MPSHYVNYCTSFFDASAVAATVVGSISNTSTPFDNEIQQSETAGTFYPEQVSLAAVDPRNTFTTFDLKKMLDLLGVVGNNIWEDGATKYGYAMWQAAYSNGQLEAGAVHRRVTFPYAYAMNRSISVSHRQDAQINCEVLGLWDLVAKPAYVAPNLALPALPASPGRWSLGPVYVAGVVIPCVTDINIDFGINPNIFACDSDEHATKLNLDSIQPTITITALDVSLFDEPGPVGGNALKAALKGVCGTHANTAINLRKRDDCKAGFKANNVDEHIRLTANGLLTINDAHSASGNQRAQIELQLTCKWDGTNSPIIPETDVALA